MASYYVWSAAAGSANGTSWTNAYTTLTTAMTGKVAGDIFYIAHDHSESSGTNLSLIPPSGTAASPSKIICANRAGSVPPVSADRRATAQIATTANALITFGNGYAHYDGIIFLSGNSTGASGISVPAADGLWLRLDNCSLRLGSTGNGKIYFGGSGAATTFHIELNNTTMSFSAVGQTVESVGVLKWRNTASALIGTAVPTTLFSPRFTVGGDVECLGVDFSAAGSGKTIVGTATTACAFRYMFVDCKLNAAVTKSTLPGNFGADDVDFVRCGSSGVNYTVFRHRRTGTLSEETTVVRTGGASDGTTPIAWRIDTNANSSFSMPFECPSIAIWNNTTGAAVTATVEGIWGGGAVPLDNDVWVDVEYLGDASSPQASFINDGTADLLTTAANQASSSATWGGSTTKFNLNVSFTPQQKGWIYARVKCAKASTTFYVDPLVTLT